MQREMKVLKEMGANFVVDGEKNRWRSMWPMLEVLEANENGIYFANFHWYVVAGQSFECTNSFCGTSSWTIQLCLG
jgi:hypothetical protein